MRILSMFQWLERLVEYVEVARLRTRRTWNAFNLTSRNNIILLGVEHFRHILVPFNSFYFVHGHGLIVTTGVLVFTSDCWSCNCTNSLVVRFLWVR